MLLFGTKLKRKQLNAKIVLQGVKIVPRTN